jgi:hypothetical protein
LHLYAAISGISLMEVSMTLSLRMFGVTGFLAVSLSATTALAHGAWIAERHGVYYVVYGHGAADDSYEPAKITTLKSCTLDLVCSDILRRDAATHVAFDKPEAPLIRLDFDNGYWSRCLVPAFGGLG